MTDGMRSYPCDAGDLLDEVLGGGEVGAPGRRGHREQRRPSRVTAQPIACRIETTSLSR